MRLVTRAALIRVGGLLLVLGVGVWWAWFTMIRMPLKSYDGPWLPLSPEETVLRDGLRRDIQALAGDIGERNIFRPDRLKAAADFIEAAFIKAGHTVQTQAYSVQSVPCRNLEVQISGREQLQEIVVVGAHYDSVSGSPGANDNASGVAALLALARALAGAQPARTLRLVAFVNEEPPFFQTGEMGSQVYAKRCRERGENIVGMISLETIGYFSEVAGSQKYPFPLRLFYPSRGNFIGFVGNTKSKELVRQCVASFRRQVKFPSEGAALPGGITGVDWSDHWAFWQEGYCAIMVTDTAPFRYPYYHTAGDTPDELDYERLARLVSGLEKVVRELVNL
jgi:hypothetical protein